ncbi:MAG: hypothetical protein Kow0068_13880 [Marinilabiliales bacterium]
MNYILLFLFLLNLVTYGQYSLPYIFSDPEQKLVYKITVKEVIIDSLDSTVPDSMNIENPIFSALMYSALDIFIDQNDPNKIKFKQCIDTLKILKLIEKDSLIVYNRLFSPYFPVMARFTNNSVLFYRNYSVSRYSAVYEIKYPIVYNFKWRSIFHFNRSRSKVIPKDTIIYVNNKKLKCKILRVDHVEENPPFKVINSEFIYLNKNYGIVKIKNKNRFYLELMDIISE